MSIRAMPRFLCSVATALGLCGQAAAGEGWSALIIGTPDPAAPSAFADAFHVGSALEKMGFHEVDVIRDSPAARIDAALRDLAGQPRVLIYYAGPVRSGADGTYLSGADRSTTEGLLLPAVLDKLAAAGTEETVVLLENCSAAGGQVAVGAEDPQPSLDISLYLAATAADGAACPPAGERLSDVLIEAARTSGVDQPLQVLLEGGVANLWVAHDTAPAIALRPDTGVIPAASEGFALIDPETAPATIVADATSVSTITPLAPGAGAAQPVSSDRSSDQSIGEVVVFAAPDQSQQAARAVAAGLPEPSIIVGLIENVTQASFSTVDDDTAGVTRNEISYDNLDARRSLRDQDPEMFAALVAAGAFDPPPSMLERALQTELQRMGCYSAGIDGIWGPGSRRSVERYFAEIDGVEPEGLEPETGLFRQIIRQDEITCSPEAAVSSVAPRATSSQPAQGQTTRSQQPASAQQPAPSAQQQTPSRTIENTNVLGVFR